MQVKVYSTPTCPWCHKLKDYLDQNKIKYQDIDVSKDQQAAEEMVKKSGQMGVPVTEVDGEMILGFDIEALREKLNIK